MLMRTRELGKSGWNWDTKFMTGGWKKIVPKGYLKKDSAMNAM
jgi:hypothetical protein